MNEPTTRRYSCTSELDTTTGELAALTTRHEIKTTSGHANIAARAHHATLHGTPIGHTAAFMVTPPANGAVVYRVCDAAVGPDDLGACHVYVQQVLDDQAIETPPEPRS